MRARLVITVLLASIAALAAASPALARSKPPAQSAGYDISYPQCGHAFPTSVLFGIVGVNGGKPYAANPCLGAGSSPSELAWAERYEPVPMLYLNTADPGPSLSSHWPDGQTSPQECNTLTSPGRDTPQCSYDYGWNAAADSYSDAVAAYRSLGQLPATATQTPQPGEWWLDVETANSWESSTSNNVQALAGAVAYLDSQGATAVGFYAVPSAWAQITGSSTIFAQRPSWVAGASDSRHAGALCGANGFTGGPVKYAQYPANGFDADVRCF